MKFQKGHIPWIKGKKLGFIPKGAFKKGNTPWNKGKKGLQIGWNKGKKHKKESKVKMSLNHRKYQSMETRNKISKTLKGRKPWNTDKHLSIAHRIKISKHHKVNGVGKWMKGRVGENNPAWRGGRTEKNKLERIRFRDTIQKNVLKRDNYTCQICKEKGGILHVDHIQPWADYVKLRFNLKNCRTLCQACHYEITYGKKMPFTLKTWGLNLSKLEDKIAEEGKTVLDATNDSVDFNTPY